MKRATIDMEFISRYCIILIFIKIKNRETRNIRALLIYPIINPILFSVPNIILNLNLNLSDSCAEIIRQEDIFTTSS